MLAPQKYRKGGREKEDHFSSLFHCTALNQPGWLNAEAENCTGTGKSRYGEKQLSWCQHIMKLQLYFSWSDLKLEIKGQMLSECIVNAVLSFLYLQQVHWASAGLQVMWLRQVQEGDLPDPSVLCFSSLVLVFLALCGGPMCLCFPKELSLGDPVIRQCFLRLAATSLQQNAIKSRGKTWSEKLKKEGLYNMNLA